MSPRSTGNNIRLSTPTSGRSGRSEQDPSDRRLKRLREEVLPFYPFLLTVPTNVPFRLGHRFVNNWAVSDDGPFTPDEHQLQYMTFLAHDESDSLLVAVGDWSDGTGSIMTNRESRPQSATSTPPSGSIKKKISLHDYKNKRKNGASLSPLGQAVSDRRGDSTRQVPHGNHTSKPLPTRDNYTEPPKKNLSQNPAALSETEHVDLNRPSERDNGHSGLQRKGGAPAKRRKLSTEPATFHPKSERSDINSLPELLSPTLPPTSSTPRLPRLLSPTLPPDLERELARLGADTMVSDSPAESPADSDTVKPRAVKERPSVGSPLKLVDKRFGLGLESSTSSGPEPARSSLHTVSNSGLLPQTASQASNTRFVHTPPTRPPRLVVKLKYGRPNRKRVEGLLKFSGKKKVPHQSPPPATATEPETSHLKKAEQGRLSLPDQPSKMILTDGKSKPVASSHGTSPSRDRSKDTRITESEKPQTPILSHAPQEKTRPVSITPAKGLKHTSSRHDLVNIDAKGHSFLASRETPSEPGLGTAKQSPSQPSSVDRNGERRAWKDEYQKYGNLGRELKHFADRHTAKDRVTNTDEKLAAVTAIEAILCFILAFIADDQSKVLSRQVGDSSTWLSIIAYWRVVRKHSVPYPPLYNLSLILGAVSYDAIHALDLERLAVMPLPGEHTPVPTPRSDGRSVNSEENKRNFKDFLELKTRLPESYKESQKLWLDGSRGLSEDFLAREFPETWSKRARTYSDQGKKRLKPGDYSGEIYLPLGRSSTPLEIIRFGCALLKEWCSNENIDWRAKLDL
ncbi:uncharacterized protein BJX67DRAFT_363444 [Aspergillus lucknowensis]|uniref:Ell binding protein Ebp1 C-terminal domain-containing protein n=1 Tax=Aspergillus lucknowensis TaxID=176173 RepID=A0ABR4LGF3_9EURO